MPLNFREKKKYITCQLDSSFMTDLKMHSIYLIYIIIPYPSLIWRHIHIQTAPLTFLFTYLPSSLPMHDQSTIAGITQFCPKMVILWKLRHDTRLRLMPGFYLRILVIYLLIWRNAQSEVCNKHLFRCLQYSKVVMQIT